MNERVYDPTVYGECLAHILDGGVPLKPYNPGWGCAAQALWPWMGVCRSSLITLDGGVSLKPYNPGWGCAAQAL